MAVLFRAKQKTALVSENERAICDRVFNESQITASEVKQKESMGGILIDLEWKGRDKGNFHAALSLSLSLNTAVHNR